jgi:hypothetical protein
MKYVFKLLISRARVISKECLLGQGLSSLTTNSDTFYSENLKERDQSDDVAKMRRNAYY